MKQSIKSTIYQAALDFHWLEISYNNEKGETSSFYYGVKDVDQSREKLSGDIFNCFKSNTCIEKPFPISIKRIISASVIEQSYYPTPQELLERFTTDRSLIQYLEVSSLDNDILSYLSDCYKNDNDPFLKDSVVVNGIDFNELIKNHVYQLDDEQFGVILENVFKKPRFESEKIYRRQEMALNIFSLDIGGKQYVVAYRTLNLNFKDKTLVMAETTSINKSFAYDEDKKWTLGIYLDMNPDEFCNHFDETPREFIDLVKENFHNGELVNTRPCLFLLNRKVFLGVDEAFEAINQMESDNALTQPLKAFFGRNRGGTGTSKEPNIVVFNKTKINIDQMRVVYNSMVYHTTYVKGPPGTGKTETIFNVLLSAYANDKKVLVCSNNNHPVDDIFKKMNSAFSKKTATNSEDPILFPVMRLGNNTEMGESINKLKAFLKFAIDHKDAEAVDASIEKQKDQSLLGYKELRILLAKHEKRQELLETVDKLEKIKSLSTSATILEKVRLQIALQKAKLSEETEIKDEDVVKFAISASEDQTFLDYLYFSALSRIKKLNSDTYKELREIILSENLTNAAIQLNKYLKDDKNLKRFTDVFPIIVCTNLSADKLGNASPHFDLCIMDESGQCNIASSLIPIVRATDLLLVGDTNQLQPVTVIETDLNDKLINKYQIKHEYNYVKNSILSTMLSKDNNSKRILLRYHYRCGKKIARFVNSRFYEEELKLINQNPGDLIYYNVHNTYNKEHRNAYEEEARGIAGIIERNHYKDVGIITPFVNQAALINKYLQERGINDVKAGTIHTLQGSERSVIIMSSALSVRTGAKTMEWVKNNHELINVAVTRAKESFIFVGDKEAIDRLSGSEISDIKALSDYVFENGETVVPPSSAIVMTDFSNNSQNEKEFFDTISPYFNRKTSKLHIKRNIPVKEAIKEIREEDYSLIGKKEFDVIVQVSGGFLGRKLTTILVFEIDGGEHVGSQTTADLDREKEAICKKYGIKMIRIANSQVKDYELIIRLFESIIQDIPDMEQLSFDSALFGENKESY